MLRSGKDQNNERSESNSTLWYNFPLNYSQVLQVVSTFRARSTVPTSAVWTTATSCSDNLIAMRSRHSTRLGSRINKYLRRHMKKVFWCFKVTEQFAQCFCKDVYIILHLLGLHYGNCIYILCISSFIAKMNYVWENVYYTPLNLNCIFVSHLY